MRRVLFFALMFLGLQFFGNHSMAGEDILNSVVLPPRILQVSQNLYRGPRPDLVTLKNLKGLGVKFDVDLENDDAAIAAEQEMANAVGIQLISMPMSAFFPPRTVEVNKILELLYNSNQVPAFVHCQHGQDRTGLIIGLYRVFYEGWRPADAYSEMLSLGFHPELIFLNHYFEKATGFED